MGTIYKATIYALNKYRQGENLSQKLLDERSLYGVRVRLELFKKYRQL